MENSSKTEKDRARKLDSRIRIKQNRHALSNLKLYLHNTLQFVLHSPARGGFNIYRFCSLQKIVQSVTMEKMGNLESSFHLFKSILEGIINVQLLLLYMNIILTLLYNVYLERIGTSLSCNRFLNLVNFTIDNAFVNISATQSSVPQN